MSASRRRGKESSRVASRSSGSHSSDKTLPELWLAGPATEVDHVADALASLKVRLPSTATDDLDDRFDTTALGLVLVALGETSETRRHFESVRRRVSQQPIYVVLSDHPRAVLVRRLYEAGASGVFEWPRENKLLAHYLAEMLSLRMVRGRAQEADTALARVVRTHLKILAQVPLLPRVEARGGVVTLIGTIDSLALKHEIERCVERIPGVRRVDMRELIVIPEPIPDRRLRQSLRRLLKQHLSIDERTLSVSVDAGRVVLAGTASHTRELRKIQELAVHLRGVRSVQMRILVAQDAKSEDRNAARRLRRTLDEMSNEKGVDLAFFRGVAILTGRVRTLNAKRGLEELVGEDSAVRRVVNKLEVIEDHS